MLRCCDCVGSLAEAEALAGRSGDGASAAEGDAEGMEVDDDKEDADDLDAELEPGEHRPAKRPRSAGTALDQVRFTFKNVQCCMCGKFFISWMNPLCTCYESCHAHIL